MIPQAISRRRFLGQAGAWLGAGTLGLRAAGGNATTISIFHTTDLHGHIVPTHTYEGVTNVGGFARCATLIRRWRRESPHSLLVDLGDVWQGTPESTLNRGGLMMGLFNRLGYDAWTMGNHDFDWGRETLEENLRLSKSPILTGNIRVGGKPPGALDGAWNSVLPWTIKEVAGFRIALIGLITPGLPYWLHPQTLGGVEVSHPLDTLRRALARARSAKADAVVVMSHMGWRHSDDFANPVREILSQTTGVDVFLGGHTHQNRPAWKHDDILCSQAGYHGIHCGRVDLVFDNDSRKLISREASTTLMDASFEPDPVVMQMASPDLKTAAAQLSRKLATVTRPIRSSGPGNPLATLFCECFAEALERNRTPVDGVFHGTFGTGDLPAGDLTVRDCWKLLPYENLLITASLDARDLIEILRHNRGNRKSDRILWPFELRLGDDGGVRSFKHRGKHVPDGARFTIALNSYDGQSGGQSMMWLRGLIARPSAKTTLTGIETRDALIEGLLNRGEIPGGDG